MYSKGFTTRNIFEVMETIYGTHHSKSKINSISQSFYSEMKDWRNQQLKAITQLFTLLDAM